MSPKKLRRRSKDQSNISISSRSKTHGWITSDRKTLPHNETNLEDQKKLQTTMLLLNNSKQKHTKTQTICLLKKKMSRKSVMMQNHKLKVNKDDVPSSKLDLRAQNIKLDNQNNGNISTDKLRSSKKNVSRKVSVFSSKKDNNYNSSSSEESQLELTLTNINDLSEEFKEIISKKPIVLLKRISLLDSLGKSLKTRSNQDLMDTTLIMKLVQKQLLNCMNTEESILSRSFNNRESTELNNTGSIVSSTPISSRSSSSLLSPILFTNERVKRNILKKDDVKNSTYDMNKTNDNQNNTMVIENEEIAVADETYELSEPRTPLLRRQFRRSETVKIDDDKKEIDKVVKVRFTTPETRMEKVQSNNNVAVRKTPRIKYISRRRSNSLSNVPTKISTPNLKCKRICVSVSNINTTPCKNSNKKETAPSSTNKQIKFNTENEGKKDIKPQSVKKKIPNFAKIHKQMFAKMESLLDNKKRLKQQHEALIAHTPKVLRLDKNKINNFKSMETKDECYNRYGFRLRKADATNIVLNKQHPNVQKKKREENRAFLNGVRTNRRFELLMKMRKISN